MKHDILEKIDEFFKEGEPMTLTKIEQFVKESIGFFEELRHVLSHGTPEEKEEALKLSDTLREKLQEASAKMLDSANLSPEMMKKSVDPLHFKPEDWKQFQNIQNSINTYQQRIETPKKEKTSRRTRPIHKEKI